MNLHLLKKVVLGVALILSETTICSAQNTEEQLNLKYWTMRERFRRYFFTYQSFVDFKLSYFFVL